MRTLIDPIFDDSDSEEEKPIYEQLLLDFEVQPRKGTI